MTDNGAAWEQTDLEESTGRPEQPWLKLRHGDSREVLRDMPDNSIDSCVTDPPYALVSITKRFGKPDAAPARDGNVYARASAGFMGKQWDTGETAFDPAFWREVLRVLKPGAHLVAFGGTRSYHRLACAIEDAGFEIRDQIGWAYGSGFPKSHDVSKGIDATLLQGGSSTVAMRRAAMGADYEAYAGAGHFRDGTTVTKNAPNPKGADFTPQTDAARQWQGWGTALKPAWEPICLARKPLIGTVAANVLAHGTGALNVDGCRVGTREKSKVTDAKHAGHAHSSYGKPSGGGKLLPPGRWPANLVHDGSDEVLAAFPQAPGQQGDESHTAPSAKTSGVYGPMKRRGEPSQHDDNDGPVGFKMKPGARRLDSGSAARFFYCAKASRADREEGLEGVAKKKAGMLSETSGQHMTRRDEGYEVKPRANNHPTVKPTDLMAWLCRLVTPPGGTVLDPFMGSGSTGKAAVREGFRFIGIERDAEYIEIARARIQAAFAAPAKPLRKVPTRRKKKAPSTIAKVPANDPSSPSQSATPLTDQNPLPVAA